ncbi:hypothetical protein LSH36_294g02013 [Paralvinella palmiformis]|uniref:Ankyrin repeat protein n=1 Tax=Paralvinella palmiformis TaxID=53620 RepID=A0AAD9JJC0_9ANNE|nr:hypothetical protein LSH36_294g02013 [Paralvinella palmiformis]
MELSLPIPDIGIQLENLILDGKITELRDILDSVSDDRIVKLEKEFPERDPVLLAVESDQGEIAVYLIERGFSCDRFYNYPGQSCNHWCSETHRSQRCPSQYDVMEVARNKNLDRVVGAIELVQKRSAKPGQGHKDATDGEPEEMVESQGKILEGLILEGRYLDVRDLLDTAKLDTVWEIEADFPDRDPVILAVENKHEDMAMYLIEKGFGFNRRYMYPNQRCDQWCYKEHQDGKCPCEYDVLELAEDKRLPRVVGLIQEIQKGLRKPGDGLASDRNDDVKVKSAKIDSGREQKDVLLSERTPNAKPVKDKIRSALIFTDALKNGNTKLHVMALQSSDGVHACVNEGINVNTQNFDGDTALHLVVKQGNLEAAKALCSNGADLTLRNKLSQTPVDISEGHLKALLQSYKRGLVSAILKGDHSAMQRISRLWPNPDAVVKPGKTALQLALEQSEKGQGHQACYNLLNDSRQSMRLVHAVLSQDITKLNRILQGSGWNINVRYKDRRGETALSCAIEQRNTELVQLLLETGKCKVDIRVREHSWTDQTVPLKFKSLDKDCPEEIWRLLEQNSDLTQLTDRDGSGQTSLLRAISNGKESSFIQMMIRTASGHNITQRNMEGLHARELAIKLRRTDVVDIIDQYLFEHPKYFLVNLAVSFYGKRHLDTVDAAGQSLIAVARTKATDADIRALTHCDVIENNGVKLFQAAAQGDVRRATRYNTANYQDHNGYTALTRAIVFNQVKVAEALVTIRPVLCSMPDNHGRHPLHYAYALPEEQGKAFIGLLLERFGSNTEHIPDKDGYLPADYQILRQNNEVLLMLHNARTLNAYGEQGPPLASLPAGATEL